MCFTLKKNDKVQQNLVFASIFFIYFLNVSTKKWKWQIYKIAFFDFKVFFIKNKKEHAAVILDMSVSDLKDDSKLMSTLKK